MTVKLECRRKRYQHQRKSMSASSSTSSVYSLKHEVEKTSARVSSQALHSMAVDTMRNAGLSASTGHRVQAGFDNLATMNLKTLEE
jgi:hypothetical protein